MAFVKTWVPVIATYLAVAAVLLYALAYKMGVA